jgi:alpha-L-rhamnosidase
MHRRLFRLLSWYLLLLAVGVFSPESGNAIAENSSDIYADSSASLVQVRELKVEHLTEPLGIEAARPRFRWLLESKERSKLQTAYQILVSSSSERLQAGIGDKWDSGKVRSENSVEVVYEGIRLASGERAYWKVRVWDEKDRGSSFSAPSFFEMGLLEPNDWKGTWIEARQVRSSPLMRREFSLYSSVRRARVYVSGIGCYELYLNGEKVGDRVLDPAPTYYSNVQDSPLSARVLYATYDVTNNMRIGENAIGVILGHGWYSAEADVSAERTPYGDRPQLIFQLNIELTDGSAVSVASNGQWKAFAGPITYNDLANGETYDARLEQPDWARPGFNDGSWGAVSLSRGPGGALVSGLLSPRKVVATLPMRRMISPREAELFNGTYIYDFGQNFTGWIRLRVSGPRGAKLRLRYGARIYEENDTLDTRSNGIPGMNDARQADTYILKGDGIEVWEPRFTVHGFRYVEIRGFKTSPSVEYIEGRVVHSDLEETGSFVSSNSLLNDIHRNIQWSFRSSLQGIPQDAADRAERGGCLGDPGFVAEDFIHNYDMAGFWEKWLNDIRGNQKDDGDVPYASPVDSSAGVYTRWPAWQSTYPLLVWYLYQHYGDRRVVEDHYDSLKKFLRFLMSNAQKHIISWDSDLGDHMEPGTDGVSRFSSARTPAAVTSTAYYYYDAVLLAKMARVLGRTGDAEEYEHLARDIEAAFNRTFFDRTTNQYSAGSQTANAIALYVGLVPNGRQVAVIKNIVDDIVNRHATHISTGIIGSNALVQVLPKYGEADLMYRLAGRTTYPSLGNQVVMGATSLCESYECGPWASQNMKMFGSLDKFFYRNLAGIHLETPGYRRVRIEPQPVGDLKRVSATQKTIRGTIGIEWIRTNASFSLDVSIPAGMEAGVVVPTLGLRDVKIMESEHVLWASRTMHPDVVGISRGKAKENAIVFEIGSGVYRFTLTGE